MQSISCCMLYLQYAMDTDQRKSLLMTQVGALDITKSKTFLAFLTYVEKLGYIKKQQGNQDKSNLLNTVYKEILKLNHTSMTSMIAQAKSYPNVNLANLIQVSKTEHYNAVAGQGWNWNQLIQSIKSTSNKTKDESDQILAL